MVGKRRHRLSESEAIIGAATPEKRQCPLCGRELIPGPSVDEHHLVPKSKGGVNKELMHKVCHQKIHSLLTEAELARNFHTWESLKAHPELAKFIAWVSKRPPAYMDRNRRHTDKR